MFSKLSTFSRMENKQNRAERGAGWTCYSRSVMHSGEFVPLQVQGNNLNSYDFFITKTMDGLRMPLPPEKCGGNPPLRLQYWWRSLYAMKTIVITF